MSAAVSPRRERLSDLLNVLPIGEADVSERIQFDYLSGNKFRFETSRQSSKSASEASLPPLVNRMLQTEFCRRMLDEVGIDAAATLVTHFAATVAVHLPTLNQAIWRASCHRLSPNLREMVVFGTGPTGEPTAGVVVLDPDLPVGREPISIPIEVVANSDAIAQAVNDPSMPLSGEMRALVSRALGSRVLDAAQQAIWAARPSVVYARAPKMEQLSVPRPPFEVNRPSNGEMSTAGALVCRSGQIGVTVAYHATGPEGTSVRIGAHTSQVTKADKVMDTAFVPLPDGINLPELHAPNGVQCDRPPWHNEPASFWGLTSGECRTKLTGFDKGVPGTRPGRQLCVQTEPDTNTGDSGAALINGMGQIVGFAFQRTAYGEEDQFTDWVWARSVFEALDLKPYRR